MIRNLYPYLRFTESKYLFYSVLFVNLIFLCFTKFYPSMDGAAHLYNSNILYNLVRGNDILSEFYSINTLPIPNWTSHFILSIFHFILPSWLTEKALLIIYVSGMALSFRFLIKELNPDNISLSVLIFPFIYSFLFHLGFYNFSISFILLFTTLGFWLKKQSDDESNFKYFILFLLITLTYFSNVLIYGFLGLLIGFYILYFTYIKYITNKNISIAFRYGGKELIMLFLVSVPSLIFLILFYINITFSPSDQTLSTHDLVKWINDARPFIVYDYLREEIVTEQFFHVLFLLLVVSFLFTKNGKEKGLNVYLGKADIIFIPLLISTILLFAIPNGSSAGMMSDRFCLIVFIFALIWTVSRAFSSKFNRIIILFILTLHFGLLRDHLNRAVSNLDKNATCIYKAGNYISENSIVLPINMSDNWLELHFSNYLGADKPMIILENYEASVGWFPVKWSSENFPNILLGDRNSVSGIQWKSNSNSINVKQIDYVLLYGNTNNINDPNWQELKEILSSDYKMKYNSENNYVMLYESL